MRHCAVSKPYNRIAEHLTVSASFVSGSCTVRTHVFRRSHRSNDGGRGSAGGAFGTWSPDGRRAAYQNGVGGDSIIVRTSDGLGSEQVVAKMQGTVSPRGWSADGNYIVFEYWATDSHNPGEIWVAPLKRGEAPESAGHNLEPSSPLGPHFLSLIHI